MFLEAVVAFTRARVTWAGPSSRRKCQGKSQASDISPPYLLCHYSHQANQKGTLNDTKESDGRWLYFLTSYFRSLLCFRQLKVWCLRCLHVHFTTFTSFSLRSQQTLRFKKGFVSSELLPNMRKSMSQSSSPGADMIRLLLSLCLTTAGFLKVLMAAMLQTKGFSSLTS